MGEEDKYDHKCLLLHILRDICTAEANGLNTHFSNLRAETEEQQNNQDFILTSLLSVLSKVQEMAVEKCPEGVTFSAELTSPQKQQIVDLQRALAALEERSDALSNHLQSLSQADAVHGRGGSLPGALPDVSEGADGDDQLELLTHDNMGGFAVAVATEADRLVKCIGSDASAITHQTETIRENLSKSRRLQGVVYDTFNEIRFKPQDLSREPPNNPKELIKGLQSMR